MRFSPKREKGLTFISLIFILAVIGFFALLILKIAPIYMDHSKVVSALKALEASPELPTQSADQIKTSLAKRFSMNYVNAITYDDIKITKRGSYVKVQAQYEVVEKIMGNASVLVQFDDVIEVGEGS
ncbi:MAG: DUF4845 domain-containing protein [Methylococcaceae bacterium]|nr:DUF4845 domain-containing protein [Methylococcaceae bacterium]